MKALITGGAGFIGSHLVEKLIQKAHKIAVIDNLSTGCIENIAPFLSNPNFEFMEGDINDASLVEKTTCDCDLIFHLAAAVGVQLIVDKPVNTIETNIHGSEVVLKIANKFKKKILIASSSEIYGKNESVPFDEDDDMVLGSTRFSRWSYACSKAVDEFLALAYHDEFQLPIIIARFFNTIGPRQTGRYGMVVPRFIESALKNEPLLIYGSGKQTRCFCYVGDVVEAICAITDCPETAGSVFNIGSTEEISIKNLADLIIEKTKSKSQKKYISYREAYGKAFDDMQRRVPKIDRIKNKTGWSPKTDLDKTLDIIIDDLRSKVTQP